MRSVSIDSLHLALAGHTLRVVVLGMLAFVGCGDIEHTTDSQPLEPANDPVAHLATVTGDVRWRQESSAAWVPATKGLELRPSETVQTMAKAFADLRFLLLKVHVRLEPNTTMRIPDQPVKTARLRHMSGRMLARLTPTKQTSRMEVELPPGTLILDASNASDLNEFGIEAQVEVDDERTAVSMLKGQGTVDRSSGTPVRVEEEHFIELASDGRVLNKGRVGLLVTPLSPKNGSRVRTRSKVSFHWKLVDDVDGYQLRINTIDGDTAVKTELSARTSKALIELPSGRYTWSIRALKNGDLGQTHEPHMLDVVLDQIPPMIELFSPASGARVKNATVAIRGRTEPQATLTVEGRQATVNSDGTFNVQTPISRGLANIVIRVADDLGNTRVVTRTILRE